MGQGSSARQDLVFEDVVVGQSWLTSAHKVSDKDIAAFAEATHDRHPLHVAGCPSTSTRRSPRLAGTK